MKKNKETRRDCNGNPEVGQVTRHGTEFFLFHNYPGGNDVGCFDDGDRVELVFVIVVVLIDEYEYIMKC